MILLLAAAALLAANGAAVPAESAVQPQSPALCRPTDMLHRALQFLLYFGEGRTITLATDEDCRQPTSTASSKTHVASVRM